MSTQTILLRIFPLIVILASFVALLTSNSCGKGIFPEVSSSASVTVTPTPVANAFLYATNFNDGTVSAFRRNTNTGALTFIAKQSAGAVIGPMGVAVPAQNDLAFVANAADGNVYEFAIAQSGNTPGNLNAVGNITSGANPQMVAIDSTGNFVYVTNAGSKTVSEYVINSQVQNVLTANGTIPGFSGKPFGIIAHPSAGLVYVADSTAGMLYAFSIGGTGALTPIGVPVESAGTSVGQPGLMAIAVDSAQSYLLVDDMLSGMVSVFLIQSDGTLAFSGSFGTGQLKPIGIAAVNDGGDTSNDYVLTSNMAGNFVQPYTRVGAVLSQLTTTVSVSSGPTGLVIDPAGLFAYTANSGNGTISLIGINSSRCGTQAFCDIENFASEGPTNPNPNAGTQFIATTH